MAPTSRLSDLMRSLHPGEKTTWSTGSLSGVAQLRDDLICCSSIWDGKVGRPAKIQTLRLLMWEWYDDALTPMHRRSNL